MNIVERNENPLLDRVELRFSVRHEGNETPSRDSLIAAVAKAEPSARRERIIVKQVSTRFGQALTTGLAFVYGSEEAMTVEPGYLLERHGFGASAAQADEAPTPAPAEQAGGEE